MRKILLTLIAWLALWSVSVGQINTDRVLRIGRNALYFEDYVLSIQYFNEVIGVKPYLAEPYLYRSIAKIYLDDYLGAAQDATSCIERNPFITTAYHVRGIARQNLKDYAGAIADFKAGLGQQPENRTFLRLLAVSYAQDRQTAAADSCFNLLVHLFPNDATGYVYRAQLHMESDSAAADARRDLDRAIELDKGNSVAFALRAMLSAEEGRYDEALDDLNRAIRLDPEQPAFYINRGLIYYNKNNLRGALADYDQAIELDPHSATALYNRGLMRAQTGDRNRAIDDFTAVLDLDPDNTFAAYNRALLRDETGDLEGAIEDYTTVYGQHPNFFPALYARAEDHRRLGRTKAADDDFKQAFTVEQRIKRGEVADNPDAELTDQERSRKESDRNIRKFNRVMSAEINDPDHRYKSAIRGRIQDRRFTVDLQPMFVLTYYEKSDEVRQSIYFERTLSDFNRAGLLSRRLQVVCQEPMLSQAQVKAHFTSIDDYSRIIGASGGNAVTYFGRSLDFMLVQDYQAAIADLNQVLMRRSDFILAYFNRAVLRFRQLEVGERTGAAAALGDDELKNSALAVGGATPEMGHNAKSALSAKEQALLDAERQQANRRVECEMAIRDLDKVVELSPTFVYAYYNRAFISSKLGNMDAALADLDKAVELYPGFAEAYYNRGLIHLRQGKTQAGIADLSKAGELGLVAAYSVLKRATSE